MTSKKFLAALLVALMVVLNFAPAATANAAATDPYCRISYDSNVGCNTVKYYYYVGGSARYDSSRLVKFYDGKILLGTSNTIVTTSHMAGTNPTWSKDGNWLVWIETNNSLQCRKYNENSNKKIADGVSALGLNAESMVETVTFANGSSKSIIDLLPTAVTPTVIPTAKPTTAPTANPTIVPTKTPTAVPTTTPTAVSTAAPASTSVKEWTDSAGQEHFEFAGNEVIVNGADVYLNDFKISELCNSGVRFIGVDSSNRVYLYEDAANQFYRFNTQNIFSPEKIKFGEGCTLIAINTDTNGYLKEVTTSIGTFNVGQLVADNSWYPASSYAINKLGYCTYYVANTNAVYVLTLKDDKLYFGTLLITSGITRNTESFGFKGSYIYYLKGSLEYKAPLSNPKNATLIKQNVAKLTYSTKTGLVSGCKKLETKIDYVSNASKKAVWYLSNKKAHSLTINSAGNQILLDGKVVAKLSKNQVKKYGKFKKVGFTETGKLFYSNTKYYYTANTETPKKVAKYSATKKNFSTETLGFIIIK